MKPAMEHRTATSHSQMGKYTGCCYQLMFLFLMCLQNARLTTQQSCSGPKAAVGNRCNFDGTEVCCVGQAACSPTSGLCECPIGKAGHLCDQVCPLNSEGDACETICGNNPCYDTGSCIDTGNDLCICNSQNEGRNCEKCIVGFKGDYCDRSCPVATDGVSCESDCALNKCDHFGLCTQLPSECVCRKGAKGPDCEIACPINSLLQTCEIACIDNACLLSGTCRETATGCQCLQRTYDNTCSRSCLIPGWTGLECTIPCPVASDRQSCEIDCRNNPCFETHTCEQTSIGCHCVPGYSGQNCNLCSPTQISGECRDYCEFDEHPCMSSYCDITTEECSCPDGLSGDNCQYCHDSYFGGCSSFCDSDCFGDKSVCNSISRSCECTLGFSGEDCRNCDPAIHPERCTSYCSQSCGSNILCDTATRECICKDGYSGSSCEYCHPSPHVNQCRDYCEFAGYACETSSSCLTTTGYCVCPTGQYGATCNYCNSDIHPDKCEQFCPSRCMGKFQVCDIRASQCLCLANFIGEECDMCIPSTHQSRCLNFCSKVCPVGTYCNTNTGECTCQDGYLGPQCMYCSPDLNPERCQQHCHYNCQKGYCYLLTRECACYEHFSGPDCSLCEPHESNNYCRQYCDVECLNGGLCDVYDGTCYCSNTIYSGRDCSLCNKTLENGECLGQCGQHCLNDGLCNTSSLACECLPGYVLGDCSWCTPEEEPNQCRQHCGVECLNSGHCDTLTDSCDCQNNFTGSDCGLCIPRLHKEKCKNYCGVECKNNATCDTQSLTCVCRPGFNGTDCSDVCTECRVSIICETGTEDCEGATNAPYFSMGSSGHTDDPQQEKVSSQKLLVGVGSAVGVILLLIIIVLVFSVCKKGNKKERSSSTQIMTADHVPMMNGQGQNYQPKCDNRYSQANIVMTTRSQSTSGNDEYDAVCDGQQGTMDTTSDLYAYASTVEMQSKEGDTVRFSDDHSQTYAYASPDARMTQTFGDDNSQTYDYASPDHAKNQSSPGVSYHHEPYNSLDFNPRKSLAPVEVDPQYNRLEVGSPPTKQGGVGSHSLPKPVRVKGNTYEDVPAESISEPSGKPALMPPYAKVNKGAKARPSLPHRTASMKIKQDVKDDDSGPMSPSYTVVEPDLSEGDSEEISQAGSNFGPRASLYAEACHDHQPSGLEDPHLSPNKTQMPPYAKVNKNKKRKSTKTKSKPDRDVYDKLQRPLTTFTIDDNDDTEEQVGEYSHLIANPHVKKGYSKLDYHNGPVPSNSPKPSQFMSANMYAELQVNYPEN